MCCLILLGNPVKIQVKHYYPSFMERKVVLTIQNKTEDPPKIYTKQSAYLFPYCEINNSFLLKIMKTNLFRRHSSLSSKKETLLPAIMLSGSIREKTCLQSMRQREFTTSPPPSKIPPHNSSNSWIIFWKSWVIFWILIWTQAGEMASSWNFRFLLCDGGQALQRFLYLLLLVQPPETWGRFWGTHHNEMRWYPFWPWITDKSAVAEFSLGTKESHIMEKFLRSESLASAYIVLQEAGSIEEVVVRLSLRDIAQRISLFSFSCCVQIREI